MSIRIVVVIVVVIFFAFHHAAIWAVEIVVFHLVFFEEHAALDEGGLVEAGFWGSVDPRLGTVRGRGVELWSGIVGSLLG